MRKLILLASFFSVLIPAFCQTPLEPPLPAGSTYYKGMIVSQKGIGIIGCDNTELIIADGSGCQAIPSGGASTNGIWERKGIVIYPNAQLPNPYLADEMSALPPTIMPACYVLTQLAHCWGAVFSAGTQLFYAESADGVNNWTWYPTAISTNHNRGSFHYIPGASGGPFFEFAADEPSGLQIDEFSGATPISMTLTHAGVITLGMVPAGWGAPTGLDNSADGGVNSGIFYLALDMDPLGSGMWSTPTSSMSVFTPVSDIMPNGSCPSGTGPSVRSPFYPFASSPSFPGGGYVTWVHCTTDNQIHRYESATLTGTYIDALGGVPEMSIESLNEGVGEPTGADGTPQIADPDAVAYNGKMYVFASAAQQIPPGSPPTTPNYQGIELFVANMPISSVLQTNGKTIGSPENQGTIGMSYNFPDAGINFNGRNIDNVEDINPASVNSTLTIPLAHVTNTLTISGPETSDVNMQLYAPTGQTLGFGANAIRDMWVLDVDGVIRPYSGIGSDNNGALGSPTDAPRYVFSHADCTTNASVFGCIIPNILTGEHYYNAPNADGTLALTSQLPSIPVPVTLGTCPGGTITGLSNAFEVTGITVGTSSCVVNFSTALSVGICTANGNTSASTMNVTSITTSSATFTFSATNTGLYAMCQ